MSVENMNDPVAANPPRSNRSFWLVGIVALVAVALGVYLIASAPRKPTELTQSASNLRHLAKGPMAAFVVKSASDPIANIVFKDESGADISLEKWRGRVVLHGEHADLGDGLLTVEVDLQPIGILIRRGVIPAAIRPPRRAAAVPVNDATRRIPTAEERRRRDRLVDGARRLADEARRPVNGARRPVDGARKL